MEKIIFILGASGSGKTTTVENIESENPDKYFFAYFDQPKVPSEEEIKKEYKDWENWGIQRTNEWFNKIKNKRKIELPSLTYKQNLQILKMLVKSLM
jgi:uridine kinase